MTFRVFCQANEENECLWKGPLGELEVFSLEFVRNIRLLHRPEFPNKENKWKMVTLQFGKSLLPIGC